MTPSKLTYGSTEITYSLIYCERKTLGITVHPDKSVVVKAPLDASTEQIEKKLRKKASWIKKQQHYFRSIVPAQSPRQYISGESHYYLGRQYLLRVTTGSPNSFRYKGRYFEAICTNKAKVKPMMEQWYRERAKIKFAEIAEPLILRFKKYNVEPSSLFIQEMHNRWGSCTQKGKIILNTALIKAPRPCIEYVIIHELCHLVHRGHTKEFYNLLGEEMPGWEKWKNKLETFI